MTTLQEVPQVTELPKRSSTGKVLLMTILGILAVGLVVAAVFLFRTIDDLKEKNNTISSLQNELVASKSEVVDLKAKLATSESTASALRNDITSFKGQIDTLQGDKTKLSADLVVTTSDLASVKSSLTSTQASLSASQSVNSSLTAELKKVKDPRHFGTLSELTDWLQKDNTDTQYASVGVLQRALILQVRALRDGFLLPVSIEANSDGVFVANVAIIGDTVYDVTSRTDGIEPYTYVTPQPSHPEPLP
jgi:peptidoglycan hydrolase CwlO-like protein